MRYFAPLVVLVSVCWGDSTVPRGAASAARGGPDARRLDGAAAAAKETHARSHRLAGPRALDDVCRGATCLTLTRDDNAVAPFLDARLIAGAEPGGALRLAVRTTRGWFVDQRPLPRPAPGDPRPVSLHRGPHGTFVLVSGWSSDLAAVAGVDGRCEQLVIACVLDGAGRPVCTAGARGAADPSCGADERTMLDWLPKAR